MSASPVAADPLINTVVSAKYEILSCLGAGGMGVVYRALQLDMDREVALKVLRSNTDADSSHNSRFKQEAQTAGRLRKHTVAVYDFGRMEDGRQYIAMELLRGESLRERLLRGPLSLHAALIIAIHVCESLADAHQQSSPIVHRDIKPDNVFVDDPPDGELDATVLDFGLARFIDPDRTRLTTENVAMGSPLYMSPEQCWGKLDIGPASDLYSLGIMIFEMVSGHPPFDSSVGSMGLMMKHIHDQAPRLRERAAFPVPEELDELVAQLLSKAPSDRPKSATETRRRLLEVFRVHSPQDPVSNASLSTNAARPIPGVGSFDAEQRNPQTTTFESSPLPAIMTPKVGNMRQRSSSRLRASAVVVGVTLLAGLVAWRVIRVSAVGASRSNAVTEHHDGQPQAPTADPGPIVVVAQVPAGDTRPATPGPANEKSGSVQVVAAVAKDTAPVPPAKESPALVESPKAAKVSIPVRPSVRPRGLKGATKEAKEGEGEPGSDPFDL